MLAKQPSQRLNMSDLIAHPWFAGKTASTEEAQAEFKQRHAKIRAVKESEKQEKAAIH